MPDALAHYLQYMQNTKWLLGGPKIPDRVWKGVHLKVLGRSCQLLLNTFFDVSTPSMRKVDDKGEKGGGK